MSEREEPPPSRFALWQMVRDLRALPRAPLAILVAVPALLTALEYWGMPWHFRRTAERLSHVPGRHMHETPSGDHSGPPLAEWFGGLDLPVPDPVKPYLWWSLACMVLLVAVPLLVSGLFARQGPRDLGIRLKGTGKEGLSYLLLFALFSPALLWAASQPGFRETYPFYRPEGSAWGKDFLIFQAAYCLQFFAVEFFFRGFMVLGLKPALGRASILVMLAPYCMIHYYKPMPEALGAIGAGLVLGALAWRTGTIMYGWFLHYGVALSMDVLSLTSAHNG